jgi:hypothetical protein
MMKRRVPQLALVLFGLFSSASVTLAQQTTYSFTGVPFTTFALGNTCPPTCTITGSFTVSQPLPPNINLPVATIDGSGTFTPESFAFTNGVETITNATAKDSGFAVNTDANGNIVQWNFYAENSATYIFGFYFPGQDSQVGFNDISGEGYFDAIGVPTGTWSSRLRISPRIAVLLPITGSPFSATFAASGGVPPYSWSASGLPEGLDLFPAGGDASIEGVPTAPSADVPFSIEGELLGLLPDEFRLTLSDVTGTSVTQSYDITVFFGGWGSAISETTKQNAFDSCVTQALSGLAITLATIVCEALPPCAPEGTVAVPEISIVVGNQLENAVSSGLLALDPPDSNFTVIAAPQPISTPPIVANGSISAGLAVALNKLLANDSSEISLKLASLTSLNRNAGAQVAHNVIWQMNQLQAAKWYSLQLSSLMAKDSSLRQAVSSSLSGTSIDIAIDPNAVNLAQQQVAQVGFTSAQTSFLMAGGMTQDQLPFLRNIIANANITFTAVDLAGTFVDPATISAITQEAASYATFGADRNNDGIVNCSDLLVVKQAFGTVRGQAAYTPMADVNDDGVVNILDLSLVSKQLPAGTVCQ